MVASTHVVNHLLWLASVRAINEHRADFYAHISPQVFNHQALDKRANFEHKASQYRATLPTLALPDDFEELPFEKLLAVRAELNVARLAFRKEVESLLKDYAAAADENSLRKVERDLLDLAKQRFEDSKKTFAAARLKTTLKAVGLTLAPPAAAAALGSMLDIALFTPAAIVAAVAFGAAEVFSLRDMAGVEERKSPWAYLTGIEAKTHKSRWKWAWKEPEVELFEDEQFLERMARPDPMYQ